MSKLLNFQVTVLGTGTSSGVPLPGCECRICSSAEPKNKRYRTSIFIEFKIQSGSTIYHKNLLVDTGPDMRTQALAYNIKRVDGVFYTHAHADHIAGIDDLRSFNFVQKAPIPLYAEKGTAKELEERYSYAFKGNPDYEGGSPPELKLNLIEPYKNFDFFGIQILPLLAYHGSLRVLGFRIKNFVYLTDCSALPDFTLNACVGVEIIILDALRARSHPTHFSIDEACNIIKKLEAKKGYLIHLSHEIDYDECNATLPNPIELSYDGLKLNF